MTMTLAELKALAEKIKAVDSYWYAPNDVHTLLRADFDYLAACSPDTILRLIACIEAADRMRNNPLHTPCGSCENNRATYDAARAALDQP